MNIFLFHAKKVYFCIALFLIAVVCVWLCLVYLPLVTQDKGVIFYVRPGISKQVFIAELSQQESIKYPILLSSYAQLQKLTYLKTGEYLFPKGSTARSIWLQVTRGTGLYYRAFTIIPGWSFNQLRQALSSTDTLKQTIQSIDNNELMRNLKSEQLNPEGQFFPDTYFYTRGVSDFVILKRAFELMQHTLMEAWNARVTDLPYQTPYEALIAASLIEKETGLDAERPIIAGVLVNRLQHGMLLQIDPTVIYGMGEKYTGKIHKNDLLEETPYNTYIHKGLPPTPIAMPSPASLNAALHPQTHDYYYFVAKGDGSHQFSKTLPEHHTAVQKHIKHLNSEVPLSPLTLDNLILPEPSLTEFLYFHYALRFK